jgi:hypothetical protein
LNRLGIGGIVRLLYVPWEKESYIRSWVWLQ